MPHRISPLAEADLDEIWLYVATESSSIEVADRLIDAITGHFLVIAAFPHAGRARDNDLGPARRSFPTGEYVIVYSVEGPDVSILRVVHGKRDLETIFNQ
jgi:toxin ParE1/3/4